MAAKIHPIPRSRRYVTYLQVDDADTGTTLPTRHERVAGEGAKALGHMGPVDTDALSALLRGWVPDGPQRWRRCNLRPLGRWRGGRRDHRPGLELTISPPKSVSILGLLGGDELIVAAHERAARRTLEGIEKDLSKPGNGIRKPGDGQGRRAEDGGGDVSPRPVASARPAHPQPLRHCERGPRRGRRVAHDVQRKDLPG